MKVILFLFFKLLPAFILRAVLLVVAAVVEVCFLSLFLPLGTSFRHKGVAGHPVHQKSIVVCHYVGGGHNLPIQAMKKLKLERFELGDPHTPHSGIGRVIPEGVRQALGRYRGGCDEKAVDCKSVDGKIGIESAKAIDVVDNDEEKRRSQGGVFFQPMEILADRNSGSRAGEKRRQRSDMAAKGKILPRLFRLEGGPLTVNESG